MSTADDSPDEVISDATAQLRHDLLAALTTMSGRAQMLERAILHSPTVTDGERARMVARVVTIQRTVREMVDDVARIGDVRNDGSNNSG